MLFFSQDWKYNYSIFGRKSFVFVQNTLQFEFLHNKSVKFVLDITNSKCYNKIKQGRFGR